MAPPADLPSNVRVSSHPCLIAKLGQLRSASATPREVKALVHEISLILGCEALASALTSTPGSKDKSPLGFEYTGADVSPGTVSIVPILRSGLAMVEGIQSILPRAVPVHHLGLYREPLTLEPVEYYNNLPHHVSSTSDPSSAPSSLAIIVDPIIATGGTCAAAIQTLKEWGVQKVLVISLLGASEGIQRAAGAWAEGTEIWVAGVDPEITKDGMLKPGLGDIGDRLFLTLGK
ncbi:related to uracil phosphoribosyltransferase [Cephalotrichum gorgonifer]|uniref:uracil phosphoribosyltransferase n=1 Tax=Cephalotrichum gorgonifer TaxID=2041049 RepID=A0AAE8SVM1_9PEZI|nr:related to uracil phosphoribosyltransferase [Cephalotrichum gorgonifer]